MIKNLGIALIIGFSSISCLPALASTETNLELPKSETVINEDIDNQTALLLAILFVQF